MCIDHAANDLGPADANGSCDCGLDHAHGATETGASSANMVRTHLTIDGMTCGHCVDSVTEELSAVEGVQSVAVRLNAGGSSKVMVTSAFELDLAAVQAAIDEAGYTLAEA